MANQEQLEILKQGVDVWNAWREINIHAEINLAGADLRKIKLRKVNLTKVNLSDADLSGADLTEANLREVHLRKCNLCESIITSASFREANLVEANLARAVLWNSDFREAHLWKADLSEADLSNAYLDQTNLWGACFKGTVLGGTVFKRVNLNTPIYLDNALHFSPSSIDTHTFQLSKGRIPEAFLRGCGLFDWEIESAKLYNPELTNDEIVKIQYRIFDLRATRSLQISPLFVSYSHADKDFVDRLDTSLTEKGIRFWRDTHDAKAGRLETQIDHAIRQNPTVLLVLSKNSLKSDWVEHEVRAARKLEKELGHDTLCPIALDDSWKSNSWPERVMEQIMEYNILDFSGWQNKSTFDRQFTKLLSGLEIFYKKPTS